MKFYHCNQSGTRDWDAGINIWYLWVMNAFPVGNMERILLEVGGMTRFTGLFFRNLFRGRSEARRVMKQWEWEGDKRWSPNR